MASESVPNSAPTAPPQLELQPLQAWLARLGLSGKILAIGGLVGVIAVFLPLVSVSVDASSLAGKAVNIAGASSSHSVLVIRDFRGMSCLAGYVAALALAFLLYPPNGLVQKALAWVGVGVGAVISLLAIWLLAAAASGTGSLFGIQVSIGIGAILNLLAGAAVAIGGFLKVREEKLI